MADYSNEHRGAEMSDRTDAVPLTTERRYGFYWMGFLTAIILILAAAGIGVALIMGIQNAGIMLAILLPILVLVAVLANLILWFQHKKAIRRREIAANEWISTTYTGQTQASAASSETPRNSRDSWFRRFSRRISTQSTPPPGYQTVVRAS